MASPTTPARSGHARRAVGIDIGYAAVRAAEIETHGDEARLARRGAAPLDPAVWDDAATGRDALAQAIRAAMSAGGISSNAVVVGLPRRLVTLKYVRLPQAEPEQIRGMVQFEAQQYIPFAIDEVVLDHQIVSDEGDEMTTVMIVAARRSLVDAVMGACDKIGLEVLRLSVSALALAEHGSAGMPIALMDVEAGEVDLAVVNAGKLLFTRAAQLGELATDPAGAQRLAGEVSRSLTSYQNEYRAQPVDRLLVAGDPAQLPAVESTLTALLDVPISRMNGRMLPPTDPEALAYATAMGLAMEAHGGGISQISLVPASRAEQKVAARRRVQSLVALGAVALVVVLAILYFTDRVTQAQKDAMAAADANRKLEVVTKARDNSKARYDKISDTYQTVVTGLGRKLPAVDLMKAVSDAVPRGSSVYLSQLSYDRTGTLAVHGTAGSESAVTDLVLALQGQGLFSQVRLNYMGDAQAQGPVGVPAAGAQTKKAEVTSFLITCRIKGSEIDQPKKPVGGTTTRTASTASGGTVAQTATGGTTP